MFGMPNIVLSVMLSRIAKRVTDAVHFLIGDYRGVFLACTTDHVRGTMQIGFFALEHVLSVLCDVGRLQQGRCTLG